MSSVVTRPCGLRGVMAAIMLAAGLCLGACDSAGPEGPDVTPTGGVRPPSSPEADMVTAVAATREKGLVDLKFSLAKRPAPGEPLEVELSLTPAVALERLNARFQVVGALDLVSGAELAAIENPEKGKAIGHKVTVLPKADGVFALTAVVVADSAKESAARSFSIPIIAGAGVAPVVAAPPAADANAAPGPSTTP